MVQNEKEKALMKTNEQYRPSNCEEQIDFEVAAKHFKEIVKRDFEMNTQLMKGENYYA